MHCTYLFLYSIAMSIHVFLTNPDWWLHVTEDSCCIKEWLDAAASHRVFMARNCKEWCTNYVDT